MANEKYYVKHRKREVVIDSFDTFKEWKAKSEERKEHDAIERI